jgi:hypothetical protein
MRKTLYNYTSRDNRVSPMRKVLSPKLQTGTVKGKTVNKKNKEISEQKEK